MVGQEKVPACPACMFTLSMNLHVLVKPHRWWLQNLRRAFQYNWRLWTIPELREMLVAAGFNQTYVWLRPMQVHQHFIQNNSVLGECCLMLIRLTSRSRQQHQCSMFCAPSVLCCLML